MPLRSETLRCRRRPIGFRTATLARVERPAEAPPPPNLRAGQPPTRLRHDPGARVCARTPDKREPADLVEVAGTATWGDAHAAGRSRSVSAVPSTLVNGRTKRGPRVCVAPPTRCELFESPGHDLGFASSRGRNGPSGHRLVTHAPQHAATMSELTAGHSPSTARSIRFCHSSVFASPSSQGQSSLASATHRSARVCHTGPSLSTTQPKLDASSRSSLTRSRSTASEYGSGVSPGSGNGPGGRQATPHAQCTSAGVEYWVWPRRVPSVAASRCSTTTSTIPPASK